MFAAGYKCVCYVKMCLCCGVRDVCIVIVCCYVNCLFFVSVNIIVGCEVGVSFLFMCVDIVIVVLVLVCGWG